MAFPKTCCVLASVLTMVVRGVDAPFHASPEQAVRQAHAELCGRLLSPQGLLWDYVGELPTPKDCGECRPNAMGWWSPIENGPMFTGPWLASMCARARRTGAAADRELCRKLADGLLLAASVSDVPGMIARGVGTDGRCHYPFGSLDQTLPWYFGLYAYWRSGLADAGQTRRIRDKMLEVARAMEAKGWQVPTDGTFRGNFCGDFTHNDLAFRGATHFLFLLRALAEVSGDARYMEEYNKARRAPCAPASQPREDVCAAGCLVDREKYDCDGMGVWIYVAAQGCLAELHRLESDPVVKAKYRLGLDRTAEAVRRTMAWSRDWRNTREVPFRYANWRTGYRWKEQKTHRDALGVAGSGNPEILGTRKELERRQVSCPLSAAAICAYAGRYRDEVERTLCRYDYSTVNISEFFHAEIAWWGLGE